MFLLHSLFLRLFAADRNRTFADQVSTGGALLKYKLCALLLCFSACAEKLPDINLAAAPTLQCALTALIVKYDLATLVQEERLAIAVADITDPHQPNVAALNPYTMMYAASVPKIAVLFALFKRIDEGQLEWSDELEQKAQQMIRSSSNTAASDLYNLVGPDYVVRLLTAKEFKLYDLSRGGGLWIGKEYGAAPAVYRDPLKGLSHAANVFSLLRFYYLLEMQKLLSPDSTLKMREIMSRSDYQSKLLRGLAKCCPEAHFLRKAGVWRDYHSDSVLVWHNNRRYIVAVLINDPRGEEILELLGEKIDLVINYPQAYCLSGRASRGR